MRIAAYNAENLFGRAKVLNFSEHQKGSEQLAIISKLQKELSKNNYDKKRIAELYSYVHDVISFNVLRSDIGYLIVSKTKYNDSADYVSPNGQGYVVYANGQSDWAGFIEFKRDKFADITSKNTAKVIKAADADILCLCEVESRPVMDQFNTDRLSSRYKFNMLIDGKVDTRGIDVGLYSKVKFGRIRTNIFEKTGQSSRGYIFSRDCLETEILLDSGKSLFILSNHLKSKWARDEEGRRKAAEKRKLQAETIRKIIEDRYDLSEQYVVVCGDLNDTPDSDPLSPLMSLDGIHDVMDLQFGTDQSKKWTYKYKNELNQIDYLLISDALKAQFTSAGVERRGMPPDATQAAGINGFSTVTNWRNAASDHALVWADFDI